MDNFLRFLNQSPTSYHAVKNGEDLLKKAGFQRLDETEKWQLKKGGSYFVSREGSLMAFRIPKKPFSEAIVLAAHTDSPGLKLKPQAEYEKESIKQLALEIYGGPLLSSWLNRDLGIAGKVLFRDNKGVVRECLVNLTKHPLIIPQLAIHLDRKVNDEGLLLNKQEHVNAVWGASKGKESYLMTALKSELPIKELLAHDLFVYPIEKAATAGFHNELISGYRLDNLASCYPILQAIARKKEVSKLAIAALWDHEEIGSETASGAQSPFFSHTLERLFLALGVPREEELRLLASSLCVSVDLAHAFNPNYPDKHDARHRPTLGGGIIVKTSAQKRYATDAKSSKELFQAAKKAQLDLQFFASRNDLPSGTTIGPIHASQTGIPTVDIGVAELSMHSCRELLAAEDVVSLEKLLYQLL